MRPISPVEALLLMATVTIIVYLMSSGKTNEFLDADGAAIKRDYAIARQQYANSRKIRAKLLSDIIQGKTSHSWRFADMYNALVPEVYCPGLIRVGDVADGGKWVCRPWALPNDCSIYSLGVNQDTTFEREMQSLSNKRCRIYAYDKNDPKKPEVLEGFDEINAKFIRALIGVYADPALEKVRIQDEMKAHGDTKMEILKIDIEGSEFAVLPELLKHTKICQILIEMHGEAERVVELMMKLSKEKYRLFSYEINGKYHQLSEYSFIHEDCLAQYNALPLAYYLEDLQK